MISGLVASRTRPFPRAGAFALLGTLAIPGQAQNIPTVVTFSILGDRVKQIGGGRVDLSTLLGPNRDIHVYQPSPAEAQPVAQVRVLVANGLDFDGRVGRLLKAAEFKGTLVTATESLTLRKSGEGLEHHAEHEGHKSENHGHDEHAAEKTHKGIEMLRVHPGTIHDSLHR